jgi:hypothetical protein
MTPPAGGDPLGAAAVVVGTLATAFAFYFAIRATFWPGEAAPEHPKRSIFKEGR